MATQQEMYENDLLANAPEAYRRYRRTITRQIEAGTYVAPTDEDAARIATTTSKPVRRPSGGSYAGAWGLHTCGCVT